MDRGGLVDGLVDYCLGKPGAEETYPWGEAELVAKVGGKAFAFLNLAGDPAAVTVKCGATAEEGEPLRLRYPGAVTASAYLGRYGWNRIALDGSVPAAELRELIDDSYADVVARLPKRSRPAG